MRLCHEDGAPTRQGGQSKSVRRLRHEHLENRLLLTANSQLPDPEDVGDTLATSQEFTYTPNQVAEVEGYVGDNTFAAKDVDIYSLLNLEVGDVVRSRVLDGGFFDDGDNDLSPAHLVIASGPRVKLFVDLLET